MLVCRSCEILGTHTGAGEDSFFWVVTPCILLNG